MKLRVSGKTIEVIEYRIESLAVRAAQEAERPTWIVMGEIDPVLAVPARGRGSP